ncbi:MAG: glycoside hydrolase family 3 C-terminal domain-containing protein, partial [Erysipelotrichaceae bacterium]|nr:glycoside hydrolase family 3 C-terminal domain-containing protein [Erysipelotrichaceae bacterium]
MELEQYEIEHLSKVREGLSECTVLLKKDGNFPLEKPCRLAAYGNGIRHSVKGGTGSGEVNAHVAVNVEQGLKDAGFEIVNDNWLDFYNEQMIKAKNTFRKQVRKEAKELGVSVLMYALGASMDEFEYEHPLNYSADAAIYVLARISGEGKERKVSKGDFYLTDTEVRDILDLNEKYERFMLVLNTGGPVDLSPV